jgi:hypothetical protein
MKVIRKFVTQVVTIPLLHNPTFNCSTKSKPKTQLLLFNFLKIYLNSDLCVLSIEPGSLNILLVSLSQY